MKTTTITHTISDKLRSIEPLIGNTPAIPVKNFQLPDNSGVFVKAEWMQLGGSVKARPALQIIKSALNKGQLNDQKTLLDASSGNTAIAYAIICARLKLNCTICIPENASTERKSMLKAFGAELVFTPAEESTEGATEKAKHIKSEDSERYFFADQYANPANTLAHETTTGPEIYRESGEKITHFVAGLGTTGTLTGTARFLKSVTPNIQIVGVQPDSPLHILEGWKNLKYDKVPEIYDESYVDRVVTVNSEEVLELIPEIAAKEGLLLSPSAAANFKAALKVAKEEEDRNVFTVFPDDYSKYGEVLKEVFN